MTLRICGLSQSTQQPRCLEVGQTDNQTNGNSHFKRKWTAVCLFLLYCHVVCNERRTPIYTYKREKVSVRLFSYVFVLHNRELG